ncbi:hypothetical protein R80B4_01247 [Fibrobacteres bacterium R8-0-B4]
MDTANDIAAKVAKLAVNAMMGDIVSTVSGVAVLIAVVAGLILIVALFSRKKRRSSGRRGSTRSKKTSRGKRKRR